MRVFRLTLTRFQDTALTGEGARLFGGRWSPPGLPVIYTAQSIALCVLEQLVHMDQRILSSLSHSSFTIDIPNDVPTEKMGIELLPEHWRATPASLTLQDIGSEWAQASRSVALTLPSAIVPTEFTTLLNPLHPDFKRLTIGDAQPFQLDSRLGQT